VTALVSVATIEIITQGRAADDIEEDALIQRRHDRSGREPSKPGGVRPRIIETTNLPDRSRFGHDRAGGPGRSDLQEEWLDVG
jgi:hypothetical protein